MKMKIRTNLTGGIFSALFAGVLWFLSLGIIEVMPNSTSVGANFFPKAMAVLLFIFSITLIVQSVFFKKEEIIELDLKGELRTMIFLAIIVAYVVLINLIGFLISTILMSSAVLWYLKCRDWKYYVICAAAAIVIFFGFTYGLRIKLPKLL